MHAPISNDPNSGTQLLQDDDPVSFTTRLDPDLFKVFWAEENRHELRFSEWLGRLDQRDRDRLERIAAVSRVIAKDKVHVERQELIRRRNGRGFR
jgi:hypothetical protein